MPKTTNTTRKTTGKIRRTFTAMLAAVMMMSTAAAFAASADNTQTVVNMNTNNSISMSQKSSSVFQVDDDLLKVKDVTSGTLFKVLEECTEYGKFFTPALSGILDLFIGAQPDPTQEKLDQINDKIDKLFDRIDKMQSELVTAFGTDLGIQSFHEVFTSFKSQTKTMRRKIEEISKDDSLTQLDKIAKIGSLAGSYSEWDIKFENVLGQLNELIQSPSGTENGSIFELIYKHYCGQVMFSGEAQEKAKPYCEALMQAYIAGCATITECLSAQLYLAQLPKEYQDKIDSAYKPHIDLNKNDIENEIKSINEHTVIRNDTTIYYFQGKPVKYFNGTGGRILPANSNVKHHVSLNKDYYYVNISRDSYVRVTPVFYTDQEFADILAAKSSSQLFKDLYDHIFEQSGRIIINKNPKGTGYDLCTKLLSCDHKDNPECNGRYWDNISNNTVNWFDSKISTMALKFDDAKAIGCYCANKGITIRTLLNSVGIDTSSVPVNAKLVTSNAFNENNSEAERLFTGCYYEKVFYNGINIDQIGAGEQKYQILDCGCNPWKSEQWNYAPGGTFCWL